MRFLIRSLAIVTLLGSADCKKSVIDENGAGDQTQTPVKSVMHLEPFVVNLADSGDNRYLRLNIDLGLQAPALAKGAKGGEGELPTARIRDCVLSVVTTWRSDALLAPEGKQKLKDQLLRALQDRAPELQVKEIYFTDFLVQR